MCLLFAIELNLFILYILWLQEVRDCEISMGTCSHWYLWELEVSKAVVGALWSMVKSWRICDMASMNPWSECYCFLRIVTCSTVVLLTARHLISV